MNRPKQDPLHPIDFHDLPATWEVVPLGDAVPDIVTGFSSGEHNNRGRGVPHLRPMNINRNGQISLLDLKYVSPRAGEARLARGDVLFNNTNSPELVGKSAVVGEDHDWAFSNHMTRLRLPTGLHPQFVAYQLRLLWEVGYFRERAKQYVNQATVALGVLRSLPLIVAPQEEQARIVDAITAALTAVDVVNVTCADLLAKLDRFRSSVIRRAAEGTLVAPEAITEGDLRETGTELLARLLQQESERWEGAQAAKAEAAGWLSLGDGGGRRKKSSPAPSSSTLPALPKDWTWARVHHVGHVMLGRQRSPEHHHGPNLKPYLRVANIFEDRIDISDVLSMNFSSEEFELYRLIRGDLLLNEGQSPELVGRPAMFRDELPEVAFQNTLIRFRAHHGVSAGFALLVFRHYFRSGRFTEVARSSTNIAHLGASRFANLPFPLPPLWEQERIVAEATTFLATADTVSERVAAVLEWVERWRLQSLRAAFRGRLTARAPDDTPASVLIDQIRATPRPIHRAKHHRTPADAAMPKKRSDRRPLRAVLEEHGGTLTPEELLRESGIVEDLIEEFFEELKRERIARTVAQDLDPDGDTVYLHLTSTP